MQLNTLKPAVGSKKAADRVGRGIGSGSGKTCKRGHKGQRSRSGAQIKPGFEGGQMPLHRRVPKFGFTSRKGLVTAQIRLSELNHVEGDVVDMKSLLAANIVNASAKHAKVFASGEIKKPVTVRGLRVSKGAKQAIEAAGGKIEE